MKYRPRLWSVILVVLLWQSLLALATDKVTPSGQVTNSVVVRETASGQATPVGALKPGESADLLYSVPYWHKVRLSDGTEGFVSKARTKVVLETATQAPPFKVHFLDVGTGDSAIIDIGDKEIVIDGGDSIKVLSDYAVQNQIIDGPIELVVVTHGDSDHWKGLTRLLGFDGQNANPPSVLEFWEPGYNRDCGPLTSYDNFIANVHNIPGIAFRRPLEATHPPATDTGQVQPFKLPNVPGVTITVLHTDSTPESTNGDCAYIINNASIVLMIESSGFKFLFTGDANGKERNEASPGTPGHIETKLLALEQAHPGTLKADVLKAPHHGSETASTQAFINAVNPSFVVISASTKHHLPKATTVQRYQSAQRVILRTDENRENNRDHVICYATAAGPLDCTYRDVLQQ